jgi:hypothetical protein
LVGLVLLNLVVYLCHLCFSFCSFHFHHFIFVSLFFDRRLLSTHCWNRRTFPNIYYIKSCGQTVVSYELLQTVFTCNERGGLFGKRTVHCRLEDRIVYFIRPSQPTNALYPHIYSVKHTMFVNIRHWKACVRHQKFTQKTLQIYIKDVTSITVNING